MPEFFQLLLDDNLTIQPGDQATYSNTAYILLGYALEVVAKKPYPQIIREKITRPLGMRDTGFDTPKLSRGIIPVGMQWFAGDFGNYKALVVNLT